MTRNTQTWRIGELRDSFMLSVVIQISLLIFSALLLDGGALGHLLGVATAGYWLWVVWLVLQRRDRLTKADTVMIRYGYLLWVAVTMFVAIGIGLIIEQTSTW